MQLFTAADALVKLPGEHDDKYSRGVLGVITGSDQYPGAAVLGVEAALRTGLGMLRYVGHERATDFVLARRPEVVAGSGRVQAWLIGSGTDHKNYSSGDAEAAMRQGLPTVLDAGALALIEQRTGPVVITPHYRELSRLVDAEPEQIAAEPAQWAARAAEQLQATVLLKGHTTYVAGPGIELAVRSAPTWLATAGAGDALAGILGALVATHSDEIADDERMLGRLAATASLIHGLAADRASQGGPFTILDLCAAIPATVAGLLAA
jgi:ADP-dependent NAD(P)H-hydrate dehydratase / NAD(P)H-hydrate epimerase